MSRSSKGKVGRRSKENSPWNSPKKGNTTLDEKKMEKRINYASTRRHITISRKFGVPSWWGTCKEVNQKGEGVLKKEWTRRRGKNSKEFNKNWGGRFTMEAEKPKCRKRSSGGKRGPDRPRRGTCSTEEEKTYVGSHKKRGDQVSNLHKERREMP